VREYIRKSKVSYFLLSFPPPRAVFLFLFWDLEKGNPEVSHFFLSVSKSEVRDLSALLGYVSITPKDPTHELSLLQPSQASVLPIWGSQAAQYLFRPLPMASVHYPLPLQLYPVWVLPARRNPAA
jgi:hypothetical protein